MLYVVQLLKSWEYKNEDFGTIIKVMLYSYLNLESTKTLTFNSRFKG